MKLQIKKGLSDTSLSYSVGGESKSKKDEDRTFEKLFTIDESSFLGEVR